MERWFITGLLMDVLGCSCSHVVCRVRDASMEPHGSGSALPSVFLVKMVVFSVGLIIMVSAVITVHLVDFNKHQ